MVADGIDPTVEKKRCKLRAQIDGNATFKGVAEELPPKLFVRLHLAKCSTQVTVEPREIRCLEAWQRISQCTCQRFSTGWRMRAGAIQR